MNDLFNGFFYSLPMQVGRQVEMNKLVYCSVNCSILLCKLVYCHRFMVMCSSIIRYTRIYNSC